MLHIGGLRFDPDGRQVWRGAREIHLTRKAFDLLAVLIEGRPGVISKEDIHARLWPNTFVAEITLHSLVSELRRALSDDAGRPRFIRNIRANPGMKRRILRLPLSIAHGRERSEQVTAVHCSCLAVTG